MTSDTQIEAIAARHAGAPDALVQILVEINRTFGHVPPEAAGVLSRALNVSVADISGTISFYSDFKKEPPPATVVQICRAEACQAAGGRRLAAHAQTRIGCDFGATAPNGATALEAVYCFGNCALAPAAAVNGRLIGRATPARLDRALAAAEAN